VNKNVQAVLTREVQALTPKWPEWRKKETPNSKKKTRTKAPKKRKNHKLKILNRRL